MRNKIILSMLSILFIVGCSQDITPSAMPGSRAVLGKVSTDKAFAAAKQALKQFYKIESIDNEQLVIRSQPTEYVSKGNGGTLAGSLGTGAPKTYRKLATIKIRQSADGQTIAIVRVDIQRRDTEMMRTFAYQRQAEDRPSEIPTEQSGVKMGGRYEVWSTVSRDYNQERAILSTLKQILGKKK